MFEKTDIFIIIYFYVTGVIAAMFQVTAWNLDVLIRGTFSFRKLFFLCLLSWFIYPVYWIEQKINHYKDK